MFQSPHDMSSNLGQEEPLSDTAGRVPPGNTMQSMNSEMFPVFSPSQTERWLKCPVYWDYGKRWASRSEIWTPERTLGRALHASMAVLFGHGLGGVAGEREMAALDAGVKVLVDEWAGSHASFQDHKNRFVQRVFPVASSYWGTRFFGEEDDILGVEVEMGPERCVADLVIKTPKGLVVIDHKLAYYLAADKTGFRVSDWSTSWQLLHYAWRASEYFEVPVVETRIHLVTWSPKVTGQVFSFEMSQEKIDHWLRSAKGVWNLMAYGEPFMNTQSCYKYGRPCTFIDLCHRMHGDESQASSLYKPGDERAW